MPQCKVFWPLQLYSEVLGVPADSQVPISGMWVSYSHFFQSRVATLMVRIVKLCLSLKSLFFKPTKLLEFELKLFSSLYLRNAIVVQCVLLVYIDMVWTHNLCTLFIILIFITTSWMQGKINLVIINIFKLHLHQTLYGDSWLSLVHKNWLTKNFGHLRLHPSCKWVEP
jgi:hypothetical protein